MNIRTFFCNRCSAHLLSFGLAALCFMVGNSFGLDLPETARLVPPDTLLLVDIDNYNKSKAQFEKTSLYRLYKDPAMAAFVEHVKSKWQKNLKEMDENNLFKALLDADVEPDGRLAIAVLPKEQNKDSNEPPAIIITQWGKNITEIKKIIAKAIQKNVEMGGHNKRTETFRGVDIEAAVDEAGTPFSYCFIDDCFIASLHPEGLKFVVAQIKGATSPTLADDVDYSATMQAVGAKADLSLYVNIKQMIKTVIAEDIRGTAQTTLTNLGFDNVRSFGASAELAIEPRKPYNIKALLKINGSKKGVCKILEPEARPLRIPRFISAEACRVSVINLDVKKLYDELSSVLMAFGPAFAAPLYQPLVPAGPEDDREIKLKEDIIDHMGREIIVGQSMKKPFSENQFPAEYVVALSITNRIALEQSLAILHEKNLAMGDPEARRELLGHTIYLIRPQNLGFFQRGGVQPMATVQVNAEMAIPTFAFAFTDTHLLCGFESSVEKAIRTLRSGESISQARWLNQAKTLLPSTAGMVSLEDTRATAEFLWWMLKTQKNEPAKVSMAPTPSYIISDMDFDFALLPEYEVVKKYLGVGASYLISRDDGFFMEFKGLDQPED